MATEGGASNIQIYLRMRPISGNPATYEVDPDEGRVQWHVPRHISLGMVNHQKERYDFLFNHIFDIDGKQEDVFEKVAQKVSCYTHTFLLYICRYICMFIYRCR